jgi:hypothetical protein
VDAGLPDGIFAYKIPIWVNFEGLGMEDVGILYGHLVYFMAVRHLCGHFVHFHVLVLFCTKKKSGNPGWMFQQMWDAWCKQDKVCVVFISNVLFLKFSVTSLLADVQLRNTVQGSML